MEGLDHPGKKFLCSEILPHRGKCFEINGEIFACGEIISPTSAGIEKGRIFTAIPPKPIFNSTQRVKLLSSELRIPDISLMASLSDECMSPHSYKSVSVPHSSKSWDMSVLDKMANTSTGKTKYRKTSSKKKAKMSKKKKPLKTSFWKGMFDLNACTRESYASKSSTSLGVSLQCPQCSRMLLIRKNANTKQKLPPFCGACKSYFVHEVETDKDELNSLVMTLSSEGQHEEKGRIVVLEKALNLLNFPFLCGSTAQIADAETRTLCTTDTSTIINSKSANENHTQIVAVDTEERVQNDKRFPTHMATSDSPLCGNEVYIKNGGSHDSDSELTFSIKSSGSIKSSSNLSIHTKDEEILILRDDTSQIQELAEKAILKKSSQNCNLTATECDRCSMALMETDGNKFCVTCPKIYAKAKKQAQLKRLEGREGLTKLEYISSESAPSFEMRSIIHQVGENDSTNLIGQDFQSDTNSSTNSKGPLDLDHLPSSNLEIPEDDNDMGESIIPYIGTQREGSPLRERFTSNELQGSWNSEEKINDIKRVEAFNDPITYLEYNNENPEAIIKLQQPSSTKQAISSFQEDYYESDPLSFARERNGMYSKYDIIVDDDSTNKESLHKNDGIAYEKGGIGNDDIRTLGGLEIDRSEAMDSSERDDIKTRYDIIVYDVSSNREIVQNNDGIASEEEDIGNDHNISTSRGSVQNNDGIASEEVGIGSNDNVSTNRESVQNNDGIAFEQVGVGKDDSIATSRESVQNNDGIASEQVGVGKDDINTVGGLENTRESTEPDADGGLEKGQKPNAWENTNTCGLTPSLQAEQIYASFTAVTTDLEFWLKSSSKIDYASKKKALESIESKNKVDATESAHSEINEVYHEQAENCVDPGTSLQQCDGICSLSQYYDTSLVEDAQSNGQRKRGCTSGDIEQTQENTMEVDDNNETVRIEETTSDSETKKREVSLLSYNEQGAVHKESKKNQLLSHEAKIVHQDSPPQKTTSSYLVRESVESPKSRYDQQMQMYLDLSSSFQKSISISSTSKDDDTLSIDHIKSTDPTGKEKHTSTTISVDDDVLEKRALEPKASNETVIVDKASDINEIKYLKEDASASKNFLMATSLSPHKGAESIEIDEVIRPDSNSFRTVDKTKSPSGMENKDRNVHCTRGSFSMRVCSPLSGDNAVVRAKYDPQPVLSMSFSLPSVGEHIPSAGQSPMHVESNHLGLKLGSMPKWQKERKPSFASAGAHEKRTYPSLDASTPFKDVTNSGDSLQTGYQRLRRGPCPEQLHSSRNIVPNPSMNILKSNTSESWGQNIHHARTIDQCSTYEVNENDTSYQDRDNHLMSLLQKLDSVALQVSALEKFKNHPKKSKMLSSHCISESLDNKNVHINDLNVSNHPYLEACTSIPRQDSDIYLANGIDEEQAILFHEESTATKTVTFGAIDTPKLTNLLLRFHIVSQSISELDRYIENHGLTSR